MNNKPVDEDWEQRALAAEARAADYRARLEHLREWLAHVVQAEFPASVAVALEVRSIDTLLAKHAETDQ